MSHDICQYGISPLSTIVAHLFFKFCRPKNLVTVATSHVEFPPTEVGQTSECKIEVKNKDSKPHVVRRKLTSTPDSYLIWQRKTTHHLDIKDIKL